MPRDILRPVKAKQLEDCWQCSDEDEARRMADWLGIQFKVQVDVVSLSQCKDLEGK